jgi:hypothetical protein
VHHDGYPKQLALARIVGLFSTPIKAKLPVVVACIAVESVKGNGKLVVLCHPNQTERNQLRLLDGYLLQSGELTLVPQREGENNYCDVFTGVKGSGNLHAHHIVSFAFLMQQYNIQSLDDALACDALWDVANGVTMIDSNHMAYHSLNKKEDY